MNDAKENNDIQGIKPGMSIPSPTSSVFKATTAPIKVVEEKGSNIISSHEATPAAKSIDAGDLIEKQREEEDNVVDILDTFDDETIFVPEDLKKIKKAFEGDSDKIKLARDIVIGMTGPFFTDYYFKMKGRFGSENIKEASKEMIKYTKILVDTMHDEGII